VFFRHKSVNGAEQYAKWLIKLRQNEQKAKTNLTCCCVSGKSQSLTVVNFDGDVRIMPLPTTKPKYSVSRLAQKHLTILINNLFSCKAVNTFRR
jgi:hypothetical protein